VITPEQSELLRTLQKDSFSYFVHKTNPANGLVLDKSRAGWPASIAAVGLALAAYPVGVERGLPALFCVARTEHRAHGDFGSARSGTDCA
jgi:hypothetical protein